MGVTSAFHTNSLKPENSDSSLGHENRRVAPEIKNKVFKEEHSLTIEKQERFHWYF